MEPSKAAQAVALGESDSELRDHHRVTDVKTPRYTFVRVSRSNTFHLQLAGQVPVGCTDSTYILPSST